MAIPFRVLLYLSTYKNHKDLSISSTTNALEGEVFSHMKNMINLDRGLSKSLVNYQKK